MLQEPSTFCPFYLTDRKYFVKNCEQNNRDIKLCELSPKFINISFYFKKMFGTFPKAFSLKATSQECNFPSGNFPKVMLGPLRRRRLHRGPSVVAKMGKGAVRHG